VKFVLLEVAPAKEKWAQSALELYTEKISHFVDFSNLVVGSKSTDRSDANAKREAEAALILKALKPDDWVVLLDERGQSLTSEKWALNLERLQMSGKKRIVWILGGAYGVTDEVKKRANLQFCLSPFVMNHLVARTVLLEQIYRSFMISKNLPYHNA